MEKTTHFLLLICSHGVNNLSNYLRIRPSLLTVSDLTNPKLASCEYLEVFHERSHSGRGAVKVPAGIHGSLTELKI